MVNVDLPLDVITEILSRLPAKSLLRFKPVCKTWYDLIRSPNFIYKHGKDSPPITSILVTTDSKVYFKDDGSYIPVDFESLFFPGTLGFFSIVGIYDGIVCIELNVDGKLEIIIGNPTTRDFRRIPSSEVPFMENDILFSGFSSIVNEHVLLRVICIVSSSEEVVIKAVVYTISTDSWVEIDVRVGRVNHHEHLFCTHWCHETMPVFWNGVFYWEASSLNDARIVSFDISKGFYDEINIPTAIIDVDEHSWRIIEFEQEISLIIYYDYRNFDLWSLNGDRNSWLWKLRIDNIPNIVGPLEGVITVLGYKSNGELLVEDRYVSDCKVLLYDMNSRETRILSCVDVERANKSYFYTESLHSIRSRNEAAQAA